MNEHEKLLEIKNLHTGFRILDEYYDAVDGVDLELYENEVLAIVGESGCGKSSLATTIMGLHDSNYTRISGSILFEGKDILKLEKEDMNEIRGGKIGMIFQDPLSSLNPLHKIGKQIEEGLKYHTKMTPEERKERVHELLLQVGLKNVDVVMEQYPHELSGGMRQRVVIAIALSCKPKIIIADEPTTALDVTIQAQILNLIEDLRKEINAGIILITHDLGVVAEMADRVAVMYAGQIIEIGTAEDIFNNAKHPYTRSLLKSIPQLDNDTSDDLYVIDGMVPSIKNIEREGCRFASRIPWIKDEEHEKNPVMHKINDHHYVRCTCYKTFDFKGGEKDDRS